MSKEYIQALNDLFGLVAFQGSFTKAQKYFDIIEEALQRLESIDNANPSEALERLKNIALSDLDSIPATAIPICEKYNEEVMEAYETIKQALLKAEQDKKKLNEIEKLTYLLYSERRKIGQEYVKWCKENNILVSDETNMITWVLAIKLKEWLK